MLRQMHSRVAAVVRNQPALVVLLLACAFAAFRYETFLTPENITNVLRQNSMAGLLALGMALAILNGGLDLSLGALLAVGAVVGAALSLHGAAVAIGGAIGASAMLGVVNGLLITAARIQPFIATLAVNMATRGMLFAWTAEESIRVAREATDFKWLARG